MVTSGYMLGMPLGMSSSILLQYELSPDPGFRICTQLSEQSLG